MLHCIVLQAKVASPSHNTSLFTLVDNEIVSAQQLDRDLEKDLMWSWQWKMQFTAEKTEEILFSVKRLPLVHPPLRLGNEE